MNFNVICMSQAGKPIFALRGTNNDDEITRVCGLIQALCTSLHNMALGELQVVTSGKCRIVFMNVHSITLVAVANNTTQEYSETTEAFLKMQLEYVHGQILLTLTEQVQSIFLQNPNYDLRETLGSASESLIADMLDKNSTDSSFLAGGIDSIYPIAPQVRDNASRVLYDIGQGTENTVFSLLLVGNKILSIVQPSFGPHQLSTFDLRLAIQFIHGRPGLLTSELWFPLCLARFHAHGFLYTYTNCLDVDTKLVLVCMSTINTTEQFQFFRNATRTARVSLGLPQIVGNVLEIINTTDNIDGSDGGKKGDEEVAAAEDVAWKRSIHHEEEDYVDASLDAEGDMIPYVFKDGLPVNIKSILLDEVQVALDPNETSRLMQQYCHEVAQAQQFLFRLDAPVPSSEKQYGNVLAQCLSSSLEDERQQRRVYGMYQKLQLRLRLGSASCESSLEAMNAISHAQVQESENNVTHNMQGIDRHCPASILIETSPVVQGVTYVIDGSDLFLAMNGREFEV